MSSPKAALQARAVPQQCKLLRLPAVGSQCAGIAELAVKEKQSHLDYLEAWLAAELEERERNPVARRLRDAHLPRMKTLEALDFSPSPKISAAEIRQRAAGGTGAADRRLWEGETALDDRAVCGRRPAETASAIYDDGGMGK